MTEGWIDKTGLFKVGVLRHNIFPFAVVKKMTKIYMMLILSLNDDDDNDDDDDDDGECIL